MPGPGTASEPRAATTQIRLRALDGANPLGMLAALGAFRIATMHDPDATLRWEQGGGWRPVLASSLDEDAFVQACVDELHRLGQRNRWRQEDDRRTARCAKAAQAAEQAVCKAVEAAADKSPEADAPLHPEARALLLRSKALLHDPGEPLARRRKLRELLSKHEPIAPAPGGGSSEPPSHPPMPSAAASLVAKAQESLALVEEALGNRGEHRRTGPPIGVEVVDNIDCIQVRAEAFRRWAEPVLRQDQAPLLPSDADFYAALACDGIVEERVDKEAAKAAKEEEAEQAEAKEAEGEAKPATAAHAADPSAADAPQDANEEEGQTDTGADADNRKKAKGKKEKDETPKVLLVAPTPFSFSNGGSGKYLLKDFANCAEYATEDSVRSLVGGPLRAEDKQTSLLWDPADQRSYALNWADPGDSKNKASCNATANALAFLGLCFLPVVPSGSRAAAIGMDRRARAFTWPLWSAPAESGTVRALLAHPGLHDASSLAPGDRARGIDAVYRSRRFFLNKRPFFSPARAV